jgi:threonine aldolase
VVVFPEAVKTNIVFFHLDESVQLTAEEVVDALRSMANIWLGRSGHDGFRAVTHYWVGAEEVALFLETLRALLRPHRQR